jgi:hypothetical protein
MPTDCAWTEEQRLGNLPIGFARGDEFPYLALAAGQCGSATGGCR